MRVEDMTVAELEAHIEGLQVERQQMEKDWMVDDPDGDWNQINREIDQAHRLLLKVRSV